MLSAVDRSSIKTTSTKIAILILGMHRSGTSSLSGTLVKLGAKAPNTLMPAAEDNKLGFFESQKITDLNDRILTSLGSRWDDWRAISWEGSSLSSLLEFETESKGLLKEEYGSAAMIAIKDPRICRIFPFWHSVLNESGYAAHVIIPIRSPLEVAASLQSRNGFPLSKGILLWLRHVLDAERDSRDGSRAILPWTDFLSDWRLSLAQASEQAGIVLPIAFEQMAAEIDQFLTPSLRHNAYSVEALTSHPDVNEWIIESYRAMEDLSRDPYSSKAQGILDDVRRDFEAGSAFFGGVLSDFEDQAHQAITGKDSACNALQAAEEQNQRLATELEATQQASQVRAGELTVALQAAEEQNQRLATELEATQQSGQTHASVLTAALQAAEEQNQRLSTELESTQQSGQTHASVLTAALQAAEEQNQ
ncbi:MAG: sulfotransferase family protein, partial [Acidithiobacillus sp.]